jgi:hypothetical protein
MLEEWIGKQIKIFLLIGQDDIIRTGQILEANDTFFKFKDKFGNIETFAISAIQQIKEAEI